MKRESVQGTVTERMEISWRRSHRLIPEVDMSQRAIQADRTENERRDTDIV
jgi:hypothetical protein